MNDWYCHLIYGTHCNTMENLYSAQGIQISDTHVCLCKVKPIMFFSEASKHPCLLDDLNMFLTAQPI